MTQHLAALNQRNLRWQPATRYLKQHIPVRLRSWLFDQASLTARLQQYCGDRGFRVHVVSQRRERVYRHEALRLEMAPRRQALVRQVYLLCGEQAVVFARTIIPLSALKGRQRRLANLGQRSLGAILFADKSMRRGNLELVRVKELNSGRMLWGRRSTFTVNGHRLLVSEIFLPALSPA